jgi:hypothetical protein
LTGKKGLKVNGKKDIVIGNKIKLGKKKFQWKKRYLHWQKKTLVRPFTLNLYIYIYIIYLFIYLLIYLIYNPIGILVGMKKKRN